MHDFYLQLFSKRSDALLLTCFLKGVSQIDISKTLGISTRSIYKWVKTYKKSGERGLEIHKRGRPKGTQLKPWQCAQVLLGSQNM